ncbi:conserved hypothetical protein [Enterobacterales bacterium 8AC]|nr:conserved hypothetical protein [Enterobacterales bacterium 8AC]
MGLFIPENVHAFQRFNFLDVPPQTIKNKLGAGVAIDDFIIEDAESVAQAKAVNLDFQQGINRFFDFVLNLTGAEETQRVIVSQKNSEASGVP